MPSRSSPACGTRSATRNGSRGRPIHAHDATKPGEQFRHEMWRARRIGRGPPPERRIDPLSVCVGDRVWSAQVHRLAYDSVVRRVQHESGAVRKDVLHDAHVRETIVEQAIAIPIVGVVEEDQVAFRRSACTRKAPVLSHVSVDRLHSVVAWRSRGVEIDPGGEIRASNVGRAIDASRTSALPEIGARRIEHAFDRVRSRFGRRRRRRGALWSRRGRRSD
jgi:hypothetical protein